jgi:hypothetical protein
MITAQIAALERRESNDLIGMSLEEAKTMTGSVQRALVESQAREAINRASKCPECQVPLRRNGSHRMSYRTPFGRLELGSPRFYRCRCQTKARQSFSLTLASAATSRCRSRLLGRVAPGLDHSPRPRILRLLLGIDVAVEFAADVANTLLLIGHQGDC